MTHTSYAVGIFLSLMVLWPIIVSAQPGTKFYWLGIDWKADNLDNTLFWVGLILIIVNGVSISYNEERDKKSKEKFAGNYGKI